MPSFYEPTKSYQDHFSKGALPERDPFLEGPLLLAQSRAEGLKLALRSNAGNGNKYRLRFTNCVLRLFSKKIDRLAAGSITAAVSCDVWREYTQWIASEKEDPLRALRMGANLVTLFGWAKTCGAEALFDQGCKAVFRDAEDRLLIRGALNFFLRNKTVLLGEALKHYCAARAQVEKTLCEEQFSAILKNESYVFGSGVFFSWGGEPKWWPQVITALTLALSSVQRIVGDIRAYLAIPEGRNRNSVKKCDAVWFELIRLQADHAVRMTFFDMISNTNDLRKSANVVEFWHDCLLGSVHKQINKEDLKKITQDSELWGLPRGLLLRTVSFWEKNREEINCSLYDSLHIACWLVGRDSPEMTPKDWDVFDAVAKILLRHHRTDCVPYMSHLLLRKIIDAQDLYPNFLSDFERNLARGVPKESLNEVVITYRLRALMDIIRTEDVSPDLIRQFDQLVTLDTPPYELQSKGYERSRRWVEDDFRRIDDVALGFSAVRLETQRLAPNIPSRWERFGNTLFKESHRISIPASSGTVAFIQREMQPEKIWLRGNSAEPFEEYKKAWPWAYQEIGLLSRAEFLFTQNLIAVWIRGASSACEIGGRGYGLVFLNNHQQDFYMRRAVLVRKDLLYDAVNFWKTAQHERSSHLEPKLVHMLRRQPYSSSSNSILEITSDSVFAGGFANAFQPGTAPYHEWERRLFHIETQDRVGHIHKSHRLGGYTEFNSAELDQQLRGLRYAEIVVHRCLRTLLNIFDLYRLAQATEHRGELLGPGWSGASFEEGEDPDTETWVQQPGALQSLMDVYVSRSNLRKRGASLAEFPILCSVHPLRYAQIPDARITLNSRTLVLGVTDDAGRRTEYQLPEDIENGRERIEAIWAQHVIPHLRNYQPDLRLYLPSQLSSLPSFMP